MMMKLKKAKAFIEKYNSFIILPHVKPDGDALGSALAIRYALESLGKRAVIWNEDILLHSLQPFFQGTFNPYKPSGNFDAVISIDTADIHRLGQRYAELDFLPLLNIDHHATNSGYGDVNLIYGGLSSTGEVIALLLEELGIVFTKEIADALYIALITDTNRFFYNSTTPATLRLGARLLEAGADFEKIHRYIFGEKPLSLLRLLGIVTEKIEFISPNIVYCRLTNDDMEKAGFYETDDVINMLRDIEGVDVAALVYDYDISRKLSLRSKGRQNVDELAQFFGGGGHLKAAGATLSDDDLPTLKTKLKELEDVGEDQFI